MKLSFVIPCYGSELTIRKVIDSIIAKMSEKPEYAFEIIAVNDCSPGKVWDILSETAKEYDFVKAIDLAKNVGKHGAILAGYHYITGDYVINLDDDGQCPIEELWNLIRPLDEGHDMAMAQYKRKQESFIKRLGSKGNNLMTRVLLNKPKDLVFTNFIARKRFVCDAMATYRNLFPYLEGLTYRVTRDIVTVPMQEHPRLAGHSGYTLIKSLRLMLNGLTAFSVVPVRIPMYTGTASLLVSLVLFIVTIVKALARPAYNTSTLLILAVMFLLGGLILWAIAVVGEYAGRTYIAVNEYPSYVVRRSVNTQSPQQE